MNEDSARLIEHAFPLKQASLDSVHEKNVRHGHISTLHIWPARRPLAACRAALIATLLPDPGTREKREELCEKIGGRVVKKVERKKMPNGAIVERERQITEGGILHWGRETENKELLEWFRQDIRSVYGGRTPKVLDPFAGGGAIPLEAMRLGCEVTAVDINPVAWFILKCTLEYPQKLAGKTWPLPDFILENEEFMEAFYRAHPHFVGRTKPTRRQLKGQEDSLFKTHRPANDRAPEANLAWHVRAWGQWVLDRARTELAQYYPIYADFEPVDVKNPRPYERQSMKRVPLKTDGTQDVDTLNAEFSKGYLADKRNPRWVAKPIVAYLWARTLKCKNCRAIIPLLKTRWLCKKERKRVLLTMEPNADRTGVVFGIENNVPVRGGNAAQRREYDRRIGPGTMSRSGAKCPCCCTIMTMQDIRLEGQAGRLGSVMTAVIIDGRSGKEYRLPYDHEIHIAGKAQKALHTLFGQIPFGLPKEPLPTEKRHRAVGSQLPGYGLKTWRDLFTDRQLLALGVLAHVTRRVGDEALAQGFSRELLDAIRHYLCLVTDKMADYGSTLATWIIGLEAVRGTFSRFAFSWAWDYCETNPIGSTAGCYQGGLTWTTTALQSMLNAGAHCDKAQVLCQSILKYSAPASFDLVVTDPPYYDAIPYGELMDFFYVWLRRTSFQEFTPTSLDRMDLSPNWDPDDNDGELIDDPGAYGGDRSKSKFAYETGMGLAFRICNNCLSPNGRMVVVFAHKQPDAWEALAAAVIRAGLIVNASWPILTERGVRTNAITTSSLASSVWLICKKRPAEARPGWDNQVLDEMRANIRKKLREFWDAGIRGPDFVWAATGPALEAYSKHPVVKKANDPGQVMTVSEFLTQVRRMVVDFVVGRVLSGDKAAGAEEPAVDKLDEPTTYYLLHRHDFGMDEAPAGACILYAIACGVSDKELSDTWDLIGFTKGKSGDQEDGDEEKVADPDAEADPDAQEDSGSKVKLKTWAQRKSRSLGVDAPGGRSVPLIDRVHCLMHLWRAGDVHKVDDYLDENGLRRQELFKRLLQSLIELSPHGSEERSLLESISNHVQARGPLKDQRQTELAFPEDERRR